MQKRISTENDGSSYFFFTIFTTLMGAINVLIVQQTHTQGAQIWFAIASPILYIINFAGLISLFWREWLSQMFEVSVVNWEPRIAGHRVPWRLSRMLDHYLAFNISASLIFMTFWVWDNSPTKTNFFLFSPGINTSNDWAMWLSFFSASFALFNGVGLLQFNLASSGSIAFTGLHIILSKPIDLFVLSILIAEGYDIVKSRREANRKNTKATSAFLARASHL